MVVVGHEKRAYLVVTQRNSDGCFVLVGDIYPQQSSVAKSMVVSCLHFDGVHWDGFKVKGSVTNGQIAARAVQREDLKKIVCGHRDVCAEE